MLAAAVAIPTATMAQAAPTMARVVGRVIDQETKRPISGAAVMIDGQGRAISDEAGWFTLDGIPGGAQQIRIDMLGYGARTESLTLRAGQTLQLEVTLAREAIALAPVEVLIRSEFLEARGFYEREREGTGTHITRAEIERKNSRQLTDILRDVPGVRLYNLESGRRHVRLNRGSPNDIPVFDPRQAFVFAGCEPDLYIDGQLFRERIPRDATEQKVTAWDVIAPEQIEGIEVYAGPNAPLQYQSPCGVVLVWTRRSPASSMTSTPQPRSAPAPVAVEPGTHARVKSRYDGRSASGHVQAMTPDTVALLTNETLRSFALRDLRTLEIDMGVAPPGARSWRGAKWGFMVSAMVIAVTAAGEEFSRGNYKGASVSATSPRNPRFALTIIGLSTASGAILGATTWKYHNWREIPIR